MLKSVVRILAIGVRERTATRERTERTMGENEHRQIARDSLFVMADVRLDGMSGDQRVRVRNLSSGGLMA